MLCWTFAHHLPFSKRAGALLTAAIGKPHPTTLADLSRTGGITAMAATRAAPELIESGLLLKSDYGYTFNHAHELATTFYDLAWRYSGVTTPPPPPEPIPGIVYTSPAPLTDTGDTHPLSSLIPASLQRRPASSNRPTIYRPGTDTDDRDTSTGTGLEWQDGPPPIVIPAADDRLPNGPGLVTARDVASQIRRLLAPLADIETALDTVYEAWRNERARDLAKAATHLAVPGYAAVTTIREHAGPDAQGNSDPHQVPISGVGWTRATYLLSAQATQLRDFIDWLGGSVHVGRDMRARNRRALTAIDRLAGQVKQHGPAGAEAPGLVSDTIELREAAKTAWDAADPDALTVSDMVRPEDVGATGDMLYAAQLHATLRHVAAIVRRMSTHPCVAAWQTTHPEESDGHPLAADTPELASFSPRTN